MNFFKHGKERCNLKQIVSFKKWCAFWHEYVLTFFESNSVLTLFLQKVPNKYYLFDMKKNLKMVDLWGVAYIYISICIPTYILHTYVYIYICIYICIYIYICRIYVQYINYPMYTIQIMSGLGPRLAGRGRWGSWTATAAGVTGGAGLPRVVVSPGKMLGTCHQIWVWVNTHRYIFSGMNIHLPAILGFTRYQGFDPSPFQHEDRDWSWFHQWKWWNMTINPWKLGISSASQLQKRWIFHEWKS